ncbi:hypothetical protein LJC19_06755, partial [Oxalobacter sp. OttesenSCG-928-P03]|nr:hypothetical protein [Oxalobacter sp. OttesenSCG-928-P03]
NRSKEKEPLSGSHDRFLLDSDDATPAIRPHDERFITCVDQARTGFSISATPQFQRHGGADGTKMAPRTEEGYGHIRLDPDGTLTYTLNSRGEKALADNKKGFIIDYVDYIGLDGELYTSQIILTASPDFCADDPRFDEVNCREACYG